jgi:hypothetical protein
VAASNVIWAQFYGSALNQIHLSPDNRFQLLFHPSHVKQAPAGILVEAHKHIDVAVVSEVLAQYRAEKPQTRNLPASAKSRYLLDWEINRGSTPVCDALDRAHTFFLSARLLKLQAANQPPPNSRSLAPDAESVTI